MTPSPSQVALEQLQTEANTVPCELPPRGCGAPAGEPCVNLAARREPGEHPPATKVPHTRRHRKALRLAGIPAPRQLEAAPTAAIPMPPLSDATRALHEHPEPDPEPEPAAVGARRDRTGEPIDLEEPPLDPWGD